MTYQAQQTFIERAANMADTHTAHSQTPWLDSYRKAQCQQFAQATFPHARIEHFKYNRFDIFAQQDFCQATQSEGDVLAEQLAVDFADTNHTDRIVFVDGQYHAKLSHTQHHRITQFCDADAAQQAKITAMLSQQQHVKHNPFVQLNAALSHHGVLIEIDNASSNATIEVVDVSTPAASNTTTATQVLFDIANNAKATAIGRAISVVDAPKEAALSTVRMIANVGEHAEFTHTHLQVENAHSLHFGSMEYNLQSSAKLAAFYAATGSILKKIDITVNHLGEHAYAGLNGLYAAADTQQIDYHTTINHTLPHGTTNENFRGIINGCAEGVFNGRIHIYPDAQKTLAELSNKNLLLSDNGVIHTKPELEIYADDVVCAHGATISRIDSESLYYLLARGIQKEEAQRMLSYAFFDEILSQLDDQRIADYIRPILFARFQSI